jgi:hypothetical protein
VKKVKLFAAAVLALAFTACGTSDESSTATSGEGSPDGG